MSSEKCSVCRGTGESTCQHCGGKGHLSTSDGYNDCEYCDGSGESVCKTCGGDGSVYF